MLAVLKNRCSLININNTNENSYSFKSMICIHCKCDDKCKQLKVKERLLIALTIIIITFIYRRLYIISFQLSIQFSFIFSFHARTSEEMTYAIHIRSSSKAQHVHNGISKMLVLEKGNDM